MEALVLAATAPGNLARGGTPPVDVEHGCWPEGDTLGYQHWWCLFGCRPSQGYTADLVQWVSVSTCRQKAALAVRQRLQRLVEITVYVCPLSLSLTCYKRNERKRYKVIHIHTYTHTYTDVHTYIQVHMLTHTTQSVCTHI